MVDRMKYSLTLLLAPAYGTALKAFARNAARCECVDTALAAELYRRQNGSWPPGLEELVPKYLPAVPVDPFTGQSLKFIVADDEFKVYSVGEDGKEDGGKFSERMEPGTDLGFVVPMRRGEAP